LINHQHQPPEPAMQFSGSQQDKDFGMISLTLVILMNQYPMHLHFSCSQTAKLSNYQITACIINPMNQVFSYSKPITLDQLNHYITHSPIYYEVIQEKLERSFTILELETMSYILN